MQRIIMTKNDRTGRRSVRPMIEFDSIKSLANSIDKSHRASTIHFIRGQVLYDVSSFVPWLSNVTVPNVSTSRQCVHFAQVQCIRFVNFIIIQFCEFRALLENKSEHIFTTYKLVHS